MNIKVLLFLLGLPVTVVAIQGEVELNITQDSNLWIGQKIVANLTVKTDAYSISGLRVDTLGNDELIIIKPESAAYKESETIGDTQWQKTVFEYVIYPMRAGDISIKPFKVTFSASMGYGQPKKNFQLKTQAIQLEVAKLKGAKDNVFVLTSTEFSLQVTYKPDVNELTVGDAFERVISIRAVDVPDLLLQPVPVYQDLATNEEAYFKVYRSEPVLSEQDINGQKIATRIEQDTFVASHKGAVILPEIEMYWWHPQMQKLASVVIPAKTMTILANPLLNAEKDSEQETLSESSVDISAKRIYYRLLGFVLALVVSMWWLFPKLKKALKLRKQKYQASEAAYFKALEQSCSTGAVQSIYADFYRWATVAMPELVPLNFQSISQHHPVIKPALDALELALMTPEISFDSRPFKQQVSDLRNALLQQKKLMDNRLIAVINP
ncbi:MAG: hypothetical protein GQ529_09305 [Methyloprofundus sp.]|nr:hypothetical protein [Methyloprofundus sp.]